MSTIVYSLARPDLIDAHLLAAAMQGVSGVLEASGGSLVGRFDFADAFGEISFIIEHWEPWLYDGMALEADYWLDGARYRFEARLRSRGGRGRLRLMRPRRIQGFERRVQPRQRVAESFCMMADSSVGIEDLSVDGALIQLHSELPPMRSGEQRQVWLSVPQTTPIPVIIEATPY